MSASTVAVLMLSAAVVVRASHRSSAGRVMIAIRILVVHLFTRVLHDVWTTITTVKTRTGDVSLFIK